MADRFRSYTDRIPVLWLRVGSAALILTSALWIGWYLTHRPYFWPVLVAGAVLLGNALFILFRPSQEKRMSALIILASLLYILAELTTLTLVCTGNMRTTWFYPQEELCYPRHPWYSSACMQSDSVRGYRWSGDARMLRIANGEITADREIHPNAQGYLFPFDYDTLKHPGLKRVIVMGSHFTEGKWLETPWPLRVHQELMRDSSAEVFSYSVDGGLPVWHEIFMREIVPSVPFDVLVLAWFTDDPVRKATFVKWEGSDLVERYDEGAEKRYHVLSDRESLDQKRKLARGEAQPAMDLHLLNSLSNYARQRWYYPDEYRRLIDRTVKYCRTLQSPYPFSYSMKAFGKDYGEENEKRLSEMIRWCRENGKEVWIVLIPEILGVRLHNDGFLLSSQVRFSEISRETGAAFYDGHKAFSGYPNDSAHKLLMVFDDSWSQLASDLFAEKFTAFARKQLGGIRADENPMQKGEGD